MMACKQANSHRSGWCVTRKSRRIVPTAHGPQVPVDYGTSTSKILGRNG